MRSAARQALLWPIVGGILGVVGLLFVASRFVRLPAPGIIQPAVPTASLIVTQSKQAGEISLFSHVPLFLPTPVNASRLDLPSEVHQEPTAIFHKVEPEYTFPIDGPALALQLPISAPPSPAAATFVGDTPNAFEGIGRLDAVSAPLAARLGVLEVREAQTGQIVLASVLEGGGASLPATWQPFQFLAFVDETGLVGEPTLMSRSGSEVVDNFFRTFLAKTFPVGKRLEPGSYRFRVGP